VGRFLPPTPLLVSVDAKGNPVTAPKPGAAFDPAALLENPEFRREWLPSRLEDAESLAERESRTLRRAAKREAERLLSDEARRLRELREINDHVREEEIVFVERQREAVCAAIEASSLRLDALRLLLP
jgi:ATP-dependent helicase HepA